MQVLPGRNECVWRQRHINQSGIAVGSIKYASIACRRSFNYRLLSANSGACVVTNLMYHLAMKEQVLRLGGHLADDPSSEADQTSSDGDRASGPAAAVTATAPTLIAIGITRPIWTLPWTGTRRWGAVRADRFVLWRGEHALGVELLPEPASWDGWSSGPMAARRWSQAGATSLVAGSR
jgi:hypothetical protein